MADFVTAHPEHRHVVRRAHIGARHPYTEIRNNLIGHDVLPIDLLRCTLSFFGAARFTGTVDLFGRGP